MTGGEGTCSQRLWRRRWFAVALLLAGLVLALVEVGVPQRPPAFCGDDPAGAGFTSLPELPVPGYPEANPVPPGSTPVKLPREASRGASRGAIREASKEANREGCLPVGGAGLASALGMGGGVEDIDFLLELLGNEAGGEQVALATKLLGYNRELEEFPAALLERILARSGEGGQESAVLLLDLSLKILCSPTWRKGAGSFAARHAIELVLAEYAGLYAAAGDLLEAVTETIGESGELLAEDLPGLLRLSGGVPGINRLVFASASQLKAEDPAWPRKSLLDIEESLQSAAPGTMEGLVEAAALSQLEPGEALDYISKKMQRTRDPFYPPPCKLRCLRILREITSRSEEDELDGWIRKAEAGSVSGLVVSSLSYQRHSRLLERLAFSGSHSWRLQAGAVVKLSGYRADEEIAQAVLSLPRGEGPGRIDLFVQAAENLLARSGVQDPWFAPVADELARSLFLQGDRQAGPVREDLVRVLELYRVASGGPVKRGED